MVPEDNDCRSTKQIYLSRACNLNGTSTTCATRQTIIPDALQAIELSNSAAQHQTLWHTYRLWHQRGIHIIFTVRNYIFSSGLIHLSECFRKKKRQECLIKLRTYIFNYIQIKDTTVKYGKQPFSTLKKPLNCKYNYRSLYCNCNENSYTFSVLNLITCDHVVVYHTSECKI